MFSHPGSINLQNLGFSKPGIERNGHDPPELVRVVLMLPDLLEPAFVGFLLDRFQLSHRGHAFPIRHVGERDSFQPVLVELVEVDCQIKDPHQHGPLPVDGPRAA